MFHVYYCYRGRCVYYKYCVHLTLCILLRRRWTALRLCQFDFSSLLFVVIWPALSIFDSNSFRDKYWAFLILLFVSLSMRRPVFHSNNKFPSLVQQAYCRCCHLFCANAIIITSPTTSNSHSSFHVLDFKGATV